jgi:hypothetical protein
MPSINGSNKIKLQTMTINSTGLNIPLDVIKQIEDHVSRKVSFTLYHDQQDFANFFPAELRVECYVGGEVSTTEQISGLKLFMDRIQLALPAYSNFFSHTPQVKNVEPIKITIGEKDVDKLELLSDPDAQL